MYQFVPIDSYPVVGHHWKEPSVHPSFRHLCTWIRSLPGSSAGWIVPAFSVFPHGRYLQPLNDLSGPLSGISSAEEKDHFSHLVGNALPNAARIPLVFPAAREHCWHTFNLMSARPPRSYKAAFQLDSHPAYTGAWAYSSPWMKFVSTKCTSKLTSYLKNHTFNNIRISRQIYSDILKCTCPYFNLLLFEVLSSTNLMLIQKDKI